MGMIYAAAELTIIAAAGTDASYGLPGVIRQSRSLTRETLESMQLTVVPPILGLEDIGRSTWAARAWTFQEGFFSRRRLVFTDHQVHFICSTARESEVKKSLFPGLASRPPSYSKIPQWLSPKILQTDQDPMRRAMEYLEQYSGRRLSYDEDALDAIVGALNVLNSESVYHLWGVPVWNPVPGFGKCTVSPLQTKKDADLLSKSSDAPCTQESKFALLWRHESPATRRAGFPSWSPIGWKSRISWYPSVTASCQGFATSVKCTESVPVLGFPHALTETEATSQYLDVTLEVTDLEIVMRSCFDVKDCLPDILVRRRPLNQLARTDAPFFTRYISASYFAFPFDGQTRVLYELYWDIDPLSKTSNVTFKGILIKQEISNPTRAQEDCVLVIEDRGDHYERVGIFWFSSHPDHVFEDGWDIEWYRRRQGLNMLDNYKKTYVNKGKWWRKFFKEEKIRLG